MLTCTADVVVKQSRATNSNFGWFKDFEVGLLNLPKMYISPSINIDLSEVFYRLI
jgi:hypothetical protein